MAGIVTNGGFRDSAIISKLDIAAYHHAPAAPTNRTLNHAIDINLPIGCGDVAVFPGDIIVGDDDGVMVIPAHVADSVAEEASQMESYEKYVMEKVMEGEPIMGLYPLTSEKKIADFEAWKAKQVNGSNS